MKTRLPNGKWWWAYLDDQGVVRVKKYVSDWEIQKVEQLPFCKGIFDVFYAETKQIAHMKIAEFLTEQQISEAKKDSWTNQFMSNGETKK